MNSKTRLYLTVLCLSALTSANAENGYSASVSEYYDKLGVTLSFPEKAVTSYSADTDEMFGQKTIMFADILKVRNVSTFAAGMTVKIDDGCTVIVEDLEDIQKPRPSHERPIDGHTVPDYEPFFKYAMLCNLALPWFHIDHDPAILENDTLMEKIHEAEEKYVLTRHESDKFTKRMNCDVVSVVRIPDMESLRTFDENKSLELLKSSFAECYGLDLYRADRYYSVRILVFMNSGKKSVDDYVRQICRYVKFDEDFTLE